MTKPQAEKINGSRRGKSGAWINATSAVLLVVIVTLAVYFFKKHWAEFLALTRVTPTYIISMSLLIITFQMVGALKVRTFTRIFGLNLTFREWFSLTQMNSLLNYLPVRGGVLLNALYLRKFFNFSYSVFLSMLGAGFVITVVVFSFMGIVGALFVFISGNHFPLAIALIYIFFIVFGIAIFLSIDRWGNMVAYPPIVRFCNGWKVMREGRWYLLLLVLLDGFLVCIDALRMTLSYHAVGVDIPYRLGLIMVPLSNLMAVASFVPGGMGVREIVIGFISREVGLGFSTGVFASALDRALLFFWILLLGAISIILLFFCRGVGTAKRLEKK